MCRSKCACGYGIIDIPSVVLGLAAHGMHWRRRIIALSLVLWDWDRVVGREDMDREGEGEVPNVSDEDWFWTWLAGDVGASVRRRRGISLAVGEHGEPDVERIAIWLRAWSLEADSELVPPSRRHVPTVGDGPCGCLRATSAVGLVIGYGCAFGRNVHWLGLVCSALLILCGGCVFALASNNAWGGEGLTCWPDSQSESWLCGTFGLDPYTALHCLWHLLVMWGLAGGISRGWWCARWFEVVRGGACGGSDTMNTLPLGYSAASLGRPLRVGLEGAFGDLVESVDRLPVRQ